MNMPADTATLNHVIGMSTHPAEGKEKQGVIHTCLQDISMAITGRKQFMILA